MPPKKQGRVAHATNQRSEHQQLPPDVVGVVAGFLPQTTEDQTTLMLVNHTWFHGVAEQDGAHLKPDIAWPFIALQRRHPGRVRIKQANAVEMEKVAHYLSAVHELVFQGDKDERTTHSYNYDGSNSSSLPSRCCVLDDATFQHLSSLKHLRSLTIGEHTKVTTTSLIQLLAAKCPQLTRLALRHCPVVSDIDLANLGSLADHLHSLDLAHCNITDSGMQHIAQLPHLTELDISGCHEISDAGMKTFTSIDHRQAMRSLKMSGSYDITDASLQHIAATMPALNHLEILHGWGVTDLGMQALVTNLKMLEVLRVFWAQQLSDDTINAIAKHSELLEDFVITRSDKVHDDAVGQLLLKMEALRSLNVNGCSGLTDAVLAQLPKKVGKKLALLNVSGCNELTSKGKLAALSHVKQLVC